MKNTTLLEFSQLEDCTHSTRTQSLLGAEESFEALLASGDYLPQRTPKRLRIVTGTVISRNKTGFIVSFGSNYKSDGFVSLKQAGDIAIGDVTRFKVTSVADEFESVELSRLEPQEIDRLKALAAGGETVMVRVDRIQRNRAGYENGLLANFEGIIGFLPKSLMAAPCKLQELIGLEIPVKIIDVESLRHGPRLLFNHAQAIRERETEFFKTVSVGQVLSVRVRKFIACGALVDLTEGVSGLIHTTKLRQAPEPLVVGQVVDAKVEFIDDNPLRCSLSLAFVERRLEELKQQRLSELSPGTITDAKVRTVEIYGSIVDLGSGVIALLHCTDLLPIGNGQERLSKGQTIQVRVKTHDSETNRISVTRNGLAG